MLRSRFAFTFGFGSANRGSTAVTEPEPRNPRTSNRTIGTIRGRFRKIRYATVGPETPDGPSTAQNALRTARIIATLRAPVKRTHTTSPSARSRRTIRETTDGCPSRRCSQADTRQALSFLDGRRICHLHLAVTEVERTRENPRAWRVRIRLELRSHPIGASMSTDGKVVWRVACSMHRTIHRCGQF